MSKVTVIIPNYNHAQYLKRRIDSVLNQTYSDFEVILMDDCSTDNSITIIESYRNHPNISHIIYNKINSGSPFHQWEKGFSLAKGDIIWIAESDDYANESFLAKLLPHFDQKDNVGIVYCDSNQVDVNNIVHSDFYKSLRNQHFNTDKWNFDYLETGYKELEDNLYFECTINNMSATLFRKKLINQINFDELLQFRYSGDWFFLVGITIQCNIYYVAEALSFFKQGTNNFKSDVKSALTYFKETSLVRYFYWQKLSSVLPHKVKKQLFKSMASQMQISINEFIKGKIKFSVLKGIFGQFYSLSPELLRKQFWYSCMRYFQK